MTGRSERSETRTRPRIGITSWPRGVDLQGEQEPNDTAPRAYVRAVERAGGLPIVLPLVDPAVIAELLDAVDGLVVSGGGDVDPARYGDSPHPETSGVDPARDAFDQALWEHVLAGEVPALGICRAVQILNVARGGTLHQHLATHRRARDEPHQVVVHAGSVLAGVVGAGPLMVNSLHHQAVDRPGDGIVVTAVGDDGVVEAVEVTGAPNVVAVQWHPELLRHQPAHLALFEDLVRRSR